MAEFGIAGFSKEHLKVIIEVRDKIDENPLFRRDYLSHPLLHSAVEWYCGTPDLPGDPRKVWEYLRKYVNREMDVCDMAHTDEWWRNIVKAEFKLESKPAFSKEQKEVISIIQDALKNNTGFKALYDDKIEFHDRINYYLNTPIDNGGTLKDPELKEFTIDLLTEIMLWRDPVREFKALLKAINTNDDKEYYDRE